MQSISSSLKVLIKFIYSEKATNFCEIFPLLLSIVHTDKNKRKDFVTFCGLRRIYGLYTTDESEPSWLEP